MEVRIVGIVSILLADLLWFLSRNLVWIAVYPPPIWKTVLDVLPFFLGVLGLLLFLFDREESPCL